MQTFAELALITVNSDPPEQTLRRVAELARTLGDVEDVSLTVIDSGRPRSVVFTGQLAVDLDERQYELGFGPCLDATKTVRLWWSIPTMSTVRIGSSPGSPPAPVFGALSRWGCRWPSAASAA
jgi:hypothetical protein